MLFSILDVKLSVHQPQVKLVCAGVVRQRLFTEKPKQTLHVTHTQPLMPSREHESPLNRKKNRLILVLFFRKRDERRKKKSCVSTGNPIIIGKKSKKNQIEIYI